MARRVLAVASSGGHWVQLLRITPAFQGCEVVYANTRAENREQVGTARFHLVRDATRWDRLGCLVLAWQMLRVVLRERPDVVISTGAAPGCIALVLGRLCGARTVWLDSVANLTRMSLSGRLVRPFAGLWLTQWPDLARAGGPEYAGTVF
jgi:UDP-N-acetylglucosamine:LPS N-acetylglucosamine transferase